ncbi:hypothetical protein AA313_de0203428 [Arthrobotrys entomopaga]|nr:hypothetical protein AA313_de0203428 [Arthrobotrys entomopaga]
MSTNLHLIYSPPPKLLFWRKGGIHGSQLKELHAEFSDAQLKERIKEAIKGFYVPEKITIVSRGTTILETNLNVIIFNEEDSLLVRAKEYGLTTARVNLNHSQGV